MPASKSHSMRAILLASLAHGVSEITGPLVSPDIHAMIEACRTLGARIDVHKERLVIQGTSGRVVLEKDRLDAGNSGQVARFMTAILALGDKPFLLDGDESIRKNRPMQPLLQALEQASVRIQAMNQAYHPPLLIQGPVCASHFSLDGQDSQPVSALLMMAALLKGKCHISVSNPGETPWIDLTLAWLHRLGIVVHHDQYRHYTVEGGKVWSGFQYAVAKDYSALAFFIGLAVITQVPLQFRGFDPDDVQCDKILLDWLAEMGADIAWQDDILCVSAAALLKGGNFDMGLSIDSVPVMAVLACYASSPTRLYNAQIARKKECDRLEVMTASLKKMGADITMTESELLIKPSTLHGCMTLGAHCDHRVVMALTIAALGANSPSRIEGTQWVEKSFPDFFPLIESLQC